MSTYTTAEVAEVVGVPVETIRNWRRLPEDHPRHLASTKNEDGEHRYEFETIKAWLRRPANTIYREVVLSLFLPRQIRDEITGPGLFGPSTVQHSEESQSQ